MTLLFITGHHYRGYVIFRGSINIIYLLGQILVFDMILLTANLLNSLSYYFRYDMLPESHTVGLIRPELLPFIIEIQNKFPNDKRRSCPSAETQEMLVKNCFNSCCFDPNGNPVAWLFAHLTGETFDGFVLPDHRGKNLYIPMCVYAYQQAEQSGQSHGHGLLPVANDTIRSVFKGTISNLSQIITTFDYLKP